MTPWYKLKIILCFKIQCYGYILCIMYILLQEKKTKKKYIKKKIFKQNGLSVTICL